MNITDESRRIYLAGEISRYNWRAQIVGENYIKEPISAFTYRWGNSGESQNAIWGQNIYTGPFLRTTQHPEGQLFSASYPFTLDQNFIQWSEACTKAIAESDIVFAWISSRYCYDTLLQLGKASLMYMKLGRPEICVIFDIRGNVADYVNCQGSCEHMMIWMRNRIPLCAREHYTVNHDTMQVVCNHCLREASKEKWKEFRPVASLDTDYGEYLQYSNSPKEALREYLIRKGYFKQYAGYDTYQEYLQSARWKKVSANVKQRAQNRCQLCNRTTETLHAHHRSYSHLGTEHEHNDLVCLCPSCHRVFHSHEQTGPDQNSLDHEKVSIPIEPLILLKMDEIMMEKHAAQTE